MAFDLGALKMSVITDTTKAEKDAQSFANQMSSYGDKLAGFGKKMATFVTLPIIGAGTAAVKMASDISENLNKMNAVFGYSGNEVEQWANTSAAAFGMSKSEFLDYVSVFGGLSQDLLKMSEKDSAEFSKQILKRSADISSYYNMSLSESNSLMQQLYSGETEG